MFAMGGGECILTVSSCNYQVTPSYYANYIWSLIHLLLIGTMAYQFSKSSTPREDDNGADSLIHS